MLRQSWWKILGVAMLYYTFIGGFLGGVPEKPILHETIRNMYFHVAMWFVMMILFIVSVIYSIKYLRSNDQLHDFYAVEFANSGILFGVMGLITGGIWANFTWGSPW